MAIDKRLDAISKLLRTGMKMLIASKADTDRKIAETDRNVEALKAGMQDLRETQKITELKLQAFIDNLNRGRNGH